MAPLITKFRYFFSPFQPDAKYSSVDELAIRKVVTSLRAKLLEDNSTVISPNKTVKNVYLIHKGSVNILEQTELFCITTLVEGSFFGEF